VTLRAEESGGGAKWRIRVSLDVMDFPGTLEELTRRIGVRPDRALKAGERIGASVKRRTADRWSIDAPADDDLSLQEQILALLKRVSPLAPQLSELPPPTTVTISCGILDYTRGVALNFEREVVAAIAEMKASLDIDYYDMSSTVTDHPGQSSQ
jgi:hypothetical protein